MTDKAAHILVAEDDKTVRLVVQQAPAPGLHRAVKGTAAGLWKLIETGRGDVLIDIALPTAMPSTCCRASRNSGRTCR